MKDGTQIVLAYDVEMPPGDSKGRPPCLPAMQRIAAIHHEFDVSGTAFIVGRLLEDPQQLAGFQEVFSEKGAGFKVESHTQDHLPLKQHPRRPDQTCRPDAQTRQRQIYRSKEIIERAFGRPVHGLRSAWGFPDGLCGEPELLQDLLAAGYDWSSSLLWAPHCMLPVPFSSPFRYTADGCSKLWELPAQGPHENITKGHSFQECTLAELTQPLEGFPPEAFPQQYITTPEQELAIYQIFIDQALERGMPYVSFIWHPWSIYKFDPHMRMLRGLIAYALSRNLPFTTMHDQYLRLMDQAA